MHNLVGPSANNMFNPRATTPAQEAIRFATTTKEQALVISLRVVNSASWLTAKIYWRAIAFYAILR